MGQAKNLIAAAILTACWPTAISVQASESFGAIEIRLVVPGLGGDGVKLTEDGSNNVVEVTRMPLLATTDFADTGKLEWTEGKPGFSVKLTPSGAKKLTELSAQNVGRRLAIIIEGRLMMTPKILDPIVTDGFLITTATEASAEQLLTEVDKALAGGTTP